MVLDYKELSNLVQLAKSGDMDAFSEIYSMTHPIIYAIALKVLENPEEAQDAVQDSYAKILNRLDSLTHADYFLPWAKKLTYNLCMNRISKRTDLLSVDVPRFIDRHSEPAPSPEHLVELSERQLALTRTIDSLPAKYRDAFKMKNYDDMSVKDIAIAMDCPVGTVKSRLSKARKLIIQKLKAENTFNSFSLLLYPASAFVPLGAKIGAAGSISGAASAGVVSGATAASVSKDSAAITGLSSTTPLACGLIASVAVSTVVVTETIPIVTSKEISSTEYITTSTPTTTDIYGNITELVEIEIDQPRILGYEYHEGTVIVTMDDVDDILLYSEIYAIDDEGIRFTPLSYDASTRMLVIELPSGNFTLYTPDMYGNDWDIYFDITY